MSPEVVKLVGRAIVNYMGGDIIKFENLVNKAIEFHNNVDKLVKCKYKVNGQWVDAKIDFSTGNIYSLDGKVLRVGGTKTC